MLKSTDEDVGRSDATQQFGSRPDRTYGDARKHSQRVRRLKIILPAGAVLITATFLAVSYLATAVPGNVELQSARIEDGKIVMEAPAISGTNADGARYSMKAKEALQDIKNPNMITLQSIDATMPVNSTVTATVVGESGIFDRETDRLEMTAPFNILLSNGMRAQFQSAHLDVPAGQMITTDPVSIDAGSTSVVASTLRMTDKGQVIIFEGDVRVTIAAEALRKKGN